MKYDRLIIFAIMFVLFASVTISPEKGYAMDGNIKSGIITLPEPVKDGSVSVEKALWNRRTTRSFSTRPLSLQDISQLLWAGQGVTGNRGFRTAPSAGALYPLEIYVAAGNVKNLPAGLYHYRSESHDLEIVSRGDHRTSIWEAALQQSAIKDAGAVFVITGIFSRTTEKYGRRGMQYVLIETGHVAQNLILQAEAMGIGHAPIGAFQDEVLKEVLKIDQDAHPLYIIPVGYR